jgi:hypothetical protein
MKWWKNGDQAIYMFGEIVGFTNGWYSLRLQTQA